MLNCANNQVANKLHSPIAIPISASGHSEFNSHCKSVQNSLRSIRPIRPNGVSSVLRSCSTCFIVLLAFFEVVCCDLGPNKSSQLSQVISLPGDRLWKPAVPINSLKSEVSFEHQNLKSIPRPADMCFGHLQNSPDRQTASSLINVA